jgi:hypothetical protein
VRAGRATKPPCARDARPSRRARDVTGALRDVQIAARHADPLTTMRYDWARQNLDRHPTTSSPPTCPPAPDRTLR